MCRLLLSDGLKAACILFWILGFGFRVSARIYIVQAAFAFCGAEETRGKTSAWRFLRLPAPLAAGGVPCGYGGSATPCRPSRHAIHHSKSTCTFRNGVQATFLGVQRTCLLSRRRGSGFAVAAKGQPAFCGQYPNPICKLLFQICSKSVPSPAGEG